MRDFFDSDFGFLAVMAIMVMFLVSLVTLGQYLGNRNDTAQLKICMESGGEWNFGECSRP